MQVIYKMYEGCIGVCRISEGCIKDVYRLVDSIVHGPSKCCNYTGGPLPGTQQADH